MPNPATLSTPLPRTPTRPPVLALFLEGLRSEDLARAHSPFLHEMKEHAALVRPLRGAPAEQLWAEVFAGVWPEHLGALSAWTLDPTDNLPASTFASWIHEGHSVLESAARRALQKWIENRRARARQLPSPALRPHALRHSIRSVDDPAVFLRPGRARVPTLLDSIVAAGGRVEHTAFPVSPAEERRLISRLGYMSRAFLDRHDLYLARLPWADRLSLQHGPGAPERHQIVRDLDGLIERLVVRFRRQWPEGTVVIASVHGSIAAHTYHDSAQRVHAQAAQYGLRPFRDYVLLVNRTLIRGWALSPPARSVLPAIAEECPDLRRYGVVLTPELARKHRLPPPGVLAGDWIWFARPGVVVYPNHFDLARSRAAYGYLFEHATPPEKPKPEGEVPADSPQNSPAEKAPDESLVEEYRAYARHDSGFVILSTSEDHKPPRAGGRELTASKTEDTDSAKPEEAPAWRVDLCTTLARLLDVRVPAASQGKNLASGAK